MELGIQFVRFSSDLRFWLFNFCIFFFSSEVINVCFNRLYLSLCWVFLVSYAVHQFQTGKFISFWTLFPLWIYVDDAVFFNLWYLKLYEQNLLFHRKYTKEHQINSYISLLLNFFSFFVVLEFLVNRKAHEMA